MKKEYARLVTLAAWTATLVASFLLLVKIAAWWVTGSVSLLASVVDSLLDIAASVVNLIVVRYALQPADREHTFGHGKAESLAALAQAMFISGSACFLILNGVERFFRPHELQSPEYGIYVSVFAMLVTFALVMFQRYVVKKTASQAIAADSLHYQTDLYMNAAIIVALGLSWFGFKQADAIFAIGIGIYILYSAFHMAYQAVQTLLDRKLPDEELAQIQAVSLSVDGVLGVHQLRTRMAGPIRFIQLHLELEDQIPLIEAHHISDQVEDKLCQTFPGADVLIHQDPYSVVFGAEKKQKHHAW
ncbi:CDF family cation-efflux transporter FieF [Vibrio sp. V27_P1S3P104]|uniref:CDF family cation-efflux transporter FieF n=1 Tax=unclassified Vibrio TaxID=2614977 RepID=UPI001372BBFE|nr:MULTISPECIES: CDF family cation-efflux transporter FieF [unclassified Vibrio]NAW70758.1 CDF family cation-efflux transporter FieF [Vibrio sp. V28_P6S34P95]NAX05950.1 CDF family cation-efflux transporter FieF [Vibrio sp. V30_P3S12P165]NAX35583.1 CDF family cation-efflux transporter FieF [Vibrio sp. V29_P1S30P107]NAX37771.1 CDF family cation-efflux transporter FieF [Vibrio sp. V27_P1S3P104]NAX40650.1 CDF family cation-efflux transporter FieF [Vibrio sp. V26_P1S5P106]